MVRIGIDVGGTFTDYVLNVSGARLISGKTPSTPGQESVGVMEAIRQVSSAAGTSLNELLESADSIDFGTTVATNALLQHRGARAAMLTTRGFRDVVALRRGYKESLVDIRLPAPEPLIPRRLRIPVTERIGADGTVRLPLAEREVQAAVRRLRAEGVESYAVCFLQSPANPAHERRCGQLVHELDPDAFVTLSSHVVGQLGEFERFSTTVLNAYLSPVLRTYIQRLLEELRANGFRGRLRVMRSNGGTATAEEIGSSGVTALLSGPAGGAVAARELAVARGQRNVIGIDMGGTSYDMSVITDGRPQVRTDAWASRHRIALPVLDIHTIGAGGGSMAWVDRGGALRVGPESAGAVPGPASYSRGGDRPTVTDANLVLGYLSAERPLGGSVRLDPARARAAIDEHVGAPLGLDTAEAAIAIHRIVNANMTNGIRFVSVARGRDPRDYALFAFGGAAATHASIQARELGIGTILVPRTAGVLSALGALLADLRVSAQRAFVRAADAVDLLELNTLLSNAWEERRSAVQASDVLHIEPRVSVDMRYDGQVHELTVPVAQSNGAVSTFDWDAAIAEFHDIHEQLYTFRMHDKPVQVTTLRLELVGVREKPDWQSGSRRPAGHTHASTGVRTVLLPLSDGSYAPAEATVYDGSKIEPGQAFQGPAIVEEESTTLVLHDGDRASLDESGIYQIAVGDAQ